MILRQIEIFIHNLSSNEYNCSDIFSKLTLVYMKRADISIAWNWLKDTLIWSVIVVCITSYKQFQQKVMQWFKDMCSAKESNHLPYG